MESFKTETSFLNTMSQALETARNELSLATYLLECGYNAGIRQINANKADWLKWLIYLAEIGFDTIKTN